MANAIPVIDLGPYLGGEPEALDRAAAELRHALTEIGFYTIVNHGVPKQSTTAAKMWSLGCVRLLEDEAPI